MGRNKGSFNFAANYEPFVRAPIDARMKVDNYSDLINPQIWETPSGDIWLYDGAIISVANDPSSGIYFLADSDNYTDYSSWVMAGGSPGPPGPSGGGGALKRSYGNVSVTGSVNWPFTVNTTIDSNRKYRFYERLSDNFDEYSHLLWSIKYENGTTYNGLQFASKQEFVDFLNANTPHSGDVVTSWWSAELYSNVSNDVGEINKMYGLNRFYSVLKGSGNYKSAIKELNEADAWSYANDFTKDVWNDLMGNSNWFTDTGGDDYTSGKKSIWFSQQKNNVYALFGNGHSIVFGNGISGSRMWWNNTNSNWENADGNSVNVIARTLVGLSTTVHDTYNVYGIPRDYILNENTSFVMVYKLEGTNSLGENVISLMIKPVGIDILRLNYIEKLNEKTLYAVFYEGNNDTSPEVRKISGYPKNSAVGDISWLVDKSKWNFKPAHINTSGRTHVGHSRPKKFRFFVGDSSGNIGGYSPEVSPFVLRPGMTFKTLVNGI